MSMDGAQSSPETALPHASSEQRPNWRRRILVWLLPAVVATVSIWIYGSAGRYVETDNAYVQQDRIDVVAQISGDVRQVLVAENERVVAGQPVLMLDDAAQRIAVAGAEARLDSARAEIQSLKAAYREKTGEAAVAARAAELSVRELARQRQLADRKLIPESQLDSVQRSADIASGGAAVLKLQVEQTSAKLGGKAELPTDEYAAVRAARADLARARLDLERTVIRAPQAGIASHLPKIGSRADAGRTAFAVVATDQLWVEANFKETDLEWVRPGQAVTVEIDTYTQHRWQGTVQSIAQATGAQFSVLPPQNASGNWVKVVQRIPVRIAIARGSDDPQLRDGMSATVKIDTGPHTRFDRWFGRRKG